MYANLAVTIDGVDHAAWAVVIANGKTTVYLDANDGDGDDPIEAGTLDASEAEHVNISADF
jgi:hypothetical protein